jgi:hypothetical protein
MTELVVYSSPYLYEVFLSYARHPNQAPFVREVFFPCLEENLKEVLQGSAEVRVFRDFDFQSIPPGCDWVKRLTDALSRSIVFVPIFTHQYFDSPYCREELAVALRKGTNLVFPVEFKDCAPCPEEVDKIQRLRLHGRVRIGERFPEVQHFKWMLSMNEEFADWIGHIANVLQVPPEWRDEWSSDSWARKAIDDLADKLKPVLRTPRL